MMHTPERRPKLDPVSQAVLIRFSIRILVLTLASSLTDQPEAVMITLLTVSAGFCLLAATFRRYPVGGPTFS